MKWPILICVLMCIAGGQANGSGATIEIRLDEFQQLMAKVEKLEKFSDEQKQINHDLLDKVDQLEAVNKAFKEVLGEQKTQVDRQKDVIHDLVKKIFQKSNSETEKASKRQAVHGYGESTVAFLASIKQGGSITNLGVHQNVVFRNVVTNIGNAYNAHQGVFIAPVSGLYLFTVTLRTGPDAELWADLIVAGNIIVRLNERGTDHRHGQCSHTIIMALKKGDDAAVQNGLANDSYYGNLYSSFAGVLLQEFESETPNIIG